MNRKERPAAPPRNLFSYRAFRHIDWVPGPLGASASAGTTDIYELTHLGERRTQAQ